MAQLLTFLGPDRTACAVASVAMARRLGQSGQRVLWASQEGSPWSTQLWGAPVSGTPTAIAEGVQAVYLGAAPLLAHSWDVVKTLEAQYLRDPLLKQVYSQELTVLPGMDEALALNALREFDASGDYDAIVFDGRDGQTTLRMWGMPDGLDWYIRRFQELIQASELARSLSPFIQPIAGVIFSGGGGSDRWQEPLGQARTFLDAGRRAVQNPRRVLGFLVTSDQPLAIAASRYLWGSAQQVGLTVGGVLALESANSTELAAAFEPLPMHPLPALSDGNWDAVLAALPDVERAIATAPRAITIDEAAGTVRLFLPGFEKSQINLTQSGPEVTIEAGDQRRNLYLPGALRNRAVRGAKFQDSYLNLSF
ncbi:ArsA family ATPase [Leptolyngbya sp. PCC 6406]|uniref:Get3/ArsA fold putative tail anchor-mediating ATPase NosAFP n=1 Tax=Leptolyngbya sp. PCC 6406 TaxID=1173264 RepID=UPI0002ACE16A|nr:ArsA family ATPase [Leptolyngbya sp. PCC 6406]